ncbi:MAG TPA: ABC transporter transmembrane domain-containing protein, partial [Candidatus Limnocylindrales bacterium]
MSFHGGGGRRPSANSTMREDQPHVPRERRWLTARKIVGFFEPYRKEVGVVFVAILVTSFLGVINPILLKLLIDVAIKNLDFGLLNLFVIMMVTIPIVSSLIGVGQTYLNNKVGQSVMRDLRAALYSHLQAMPLRFFTETRTGEI